MLRLVAILLLGISGTHNAELGRAGTSEKSLHWWPWSTPDYENGVTFFLMNELHPTGIRVSYNEKSLIKNGFDGTRSLTVIIHGYTHTHTDASVVTSIAPELLKARVSTNVLAVDWGVLARYPWYWSARDNVGPVGVQVAKFIRFLVGRGLASPANVHIIGHSLGAHVAASAGREFKGQIGRITGLDPAAPLFFSFSQDRLRSDAAVLVDVIHTCGGLMGLSTPAGHVDFYPNRGRIFQPGCGFMDDGWGTGNCSHERAVFLFAESVGNPVAFPATASCKSYNEALGRKCSGSGQSEGVDVHMGYHAKYLKPGVYYLETSASPPYSLNKKDTN